MWRILRGRHKRTLFAPEGGQYGNLHLGTNFDRLWPELKKLGGGWQCWYGHCLCSVFYRLDWSKRMVNLVPSYTVINNDNNVTHIGSSACKMQCGLNKDLTHLQWQLLPCYSLSMTSICNCSIFARFCKEVYCVKGASQLGIYSVVGTDHCPWRPWAPAPRSVPSSSSCSWSSTRGTPVDKTQQRKISAFQKKKKKKTFHAKGKGLSYSWVFQVWYNSKWIAPAVKLQATRVLEKGFWLVVRGSM